MRHALRALARQPAFSAAAILTLALGIGANTAVFSVVHGVLLRTLPFHDPDRLTFLHLETRVPIYSKAEFRFLRERARSFTDLAARGPERGAVLVGRGDPRALRTSTLSHNLVQLLGIRPLLGRGFDSSDATSGDHVVVISRALWVSVFGADSGAVGTTITLDTLGSRGRYTVIGVLPPSLQLLHPGTVDLWFPIDLATDPTAKRASLQLVGRLRPGATLASAQAEFRALLPGMKEYAQVYPADYRLAGSVVRLDEWVVGDRSGLLWLLLGCSGFVLLIACANVANLFLVRSTARRREMAVRVALGASKGTLLRLVLAESLIVASLGGLLGVVLAGLAHGLLLASLPVDLSRWGDLGLSAPILLVAFVLSGLAAGCFALLPALGLERRDVVGRIISAGVRSGVARPSGRVLRAIMTAEIALALVLTLGTGLMIRTVRALRGEESGIATRQLVAVTLQVQDQLEGRGADPFGEILDRVAAIPGVDHAALTYHVPLSGSSSITTVRLENHPTIPSDAGQTVGFQIVSPEFFRTVGIPLLRGETFSRQPVVAESQIVVNEAFAKQFWPGDNALGRIVSGTGRRTIVGVVGDTRHRGLQLPPRPEAYFPTSSFRRAEMSLVVRSPLPLDAVTRAIRAEAAGLRSDIPITASRSLDQVVATSMAAELHTLRLLGLFAALALVLGAVGVYGVVAYVVSQRQRELVVRVALGARTSHVVRQVMIWSLKHVAVGVAAGVLLSLALTRALRGLLFGVSPTDGPTFGAAAALLVLVAAAATAWPALRAVRVRPADVLRHD